MTSILEQAQELIHGERQKDYGHPRDNITHTADLFSAYLGIEVSALDVSALMILLKLSRVHGTGYHRDSIVDIAGYAGVAERVYEEPDLSNETWANGGPKPPTVEEWDEFDRKVFHTARQWESMADIPKDVKVRGVGGEVWKWREDYDSWLWSSDGEPVNYTLIGAPYTEIIEEWEINE